MQHTHHKASVPFAFHFRTFLILLVAACFTACSAAKKASTPHKSRPGQPPRPPVTRPARSEPMDTIRWTTPVNPKPPIGNAPAQPGVQPGMPGETYRLALLLPFLTNQMEGNAVPEKSRLALQFYAGAKIALEEISQTENINLVVNVYDTQINDADFLQLLNDARLNRSDVFIGPVRNSHLSAMSSWTKQHHKILVSPESPTSELTAQNPDFIQTNPSLRAHCEAITQYVLAKHGADAVTLVCKEREADRLPYFHQANALPGSRRFSELIVPDATANFDKIDLRPYLKAGRTSVFILPTWASQDFVMAFLRKLRTAKGNYDVEVYGMPQWASYESIEPEYFRTLNVHISSASYIDYSAPEVRVFQQKFYDATGTIPDDDGFNGYDVTLYVGRMLRRYGLSFPFRVQAEPMEGLHNTFRFQRIFNNGAIDDGFNTPDYLENTHVHILKFEQYGFVPAE